MILLLVLLLLFFASISILFIGLVLNDMQKDVNSDNREGEGEADGPI